MSITKEDLKKIHDLSWSGYPNYDVTKGILPDMRNGVFSEEDLKRVMTIIDLIKGKADPNSVQAEEMKRYI